MKLWIIKGQVLASKPFYCLLLYHVIYKATETSILNVNNNSFSPGARFSKAPETFRARKAIAKSRTLRLQSCFIHIFLIWREVPYIQEVSGVYTSPSLGTVELKMAFRARKVSGSFEKRAPGARFSKVPVTLRARNQIFKSKYKE